MALSIYFTIIFIMILMNVKSATQGNTDSSLAISITLSTILIVTYLICVLSIIYYSISFNNRNPKAISLFYSASTFLGKNNLFCLRDILINKEFILIILIPSCVYQNRNHNDARISPDDFLRHKCWDLPSLALYL